MAREFLIPLSGNFVAWNPKKIDDVSRKIAAAFAIRLIQPSCVRPLYFEIQQPTNCFQKSNGDILVDKRICLSAFLRLLKKWDPTCIQERREPDHRLLEFLLLFLERPGCPQAIKFACNAFFCVMRICCSNLHNLDIKAYRPISACTLPE